MPRVADTRWDDARLTVNTLNALPGYRGGFLMRDPTASSKARKRAVAATQMRASECFGVVNSFSYFTISILSRSRPLLYVVRPRRSRLPDDNNNNV